MADEEHLKLLKQGVEVWNRWRKENPEIQPDLSETDLRGVDLRGVNLMRAGLIGADLGGTRLSGAHLGWADLSGADLSGAYLRRAYFGGADLRGADLGSAYLREAYLGGADLREAYLGGADLIEADLCRANLSEADLSGAKVGYTVFADVDLSVVKGLDTVRHLGPSTIGIDTIYRSGGKIPEAFLRGAGVPDTFITYVASLTGEAIRYYSCFISYSSKDEAFAQRLHADLQAKGVRCWFAPKDMKVGDKIRPRIDESIRLHDKLLVVLSQHSIHSAWVEKEVETAFEEESKRRKTALFPVRLDAAVMETDRAWAADIRRTRHIGDFENWKDHDAYQQAFERLLRDLKEEK
jgi:hypothetical protein